jgi:hypothetical protein
MSKWEFLSKVKGEHRFWKHPDHPGQIAISDQSADGRGRMGRPDETDDGVLFLDSARQIRRCEGNADTYLVPVVTPDGEKSHTSSSLKEATFIRRTFGMGGAPADKEHPWASRFREVTTPKEACGAIREFFDGMEDTNPAYEEMVKMLERVS